MRGQARAMLARARLGARLTRSLVLIPLFGALLLAAMWTAFVVRQHNERAAVLATELRQIDSVAAAFSEHTLRKLRDIDRTSWVIKAQFERDGIVNLPYLARNRLVPTDGSIRISVTDSTGKVVASNRDFTSTVSVADRDFFRLHAATDTGALDISRSFSGHQFGPGTFRASRRLKQGDGSFGGVVILSADPSHFADFYRESQLGPNGLLAILGLDGRYRMRRTGGRIESDVDGTATPLFAAATASDEGAYIGESVIDNQRRMVAYRKLADYPLIVAVARAEGEVMAQFDHYWGNYLIASVVASTFIVVFFSFYTVLAYRARRIAIDVRRRQSFLQAMFDNAPLGVLVRSMKAPDRGRIVVWNRAAETIYGVPAALALGRTIDDILSPEYAAGTAERDRRMLASPMVQNGPPVTADLQHIGRRVLRVVRAPIFDAQGEVEHVLSIVHDVTADEAHADVLRLSAKVFDTTADAIVISDKDDVVISVNPAFSQLTGFEPAEMIGKLVLDSPFRPFDAGEHEALQATLMREGCVTTEVLRHRKDGTPLPCWLTKTLVRGGDGGIVNYVRVFTDISELKDAYRTLEKVAHADPLTGLKNRRVFYDRLEQALGRAARSGRAVGLLFIDLDDFKGINDTHGHDAGDAVLREVATRLLQCVRTTDSVCRLGGDEFTIVMEDATLPRDAYLVAERIADSLERPIDVGGVLVRCRASVGVACSPEHGRDAESLLAGADRAMYMAKAARKDSGAGAERVVVELR
jgi:diguanylate cyclase (GGDEF)-like protein/PAS domain S-box-containing protein